MNYRALQAFPASEGAGFYLTAQRYANHLWQTGHAGRSILALARALYAELDPKDPVLHEWPRPYQALAWIVGAHESDDFPGNPRISFEHQAVRMRGTRLSIKRSRAWAAWAIIRARRPSLAGDSDTLVQEPSLFQIFARLRSDGDPDEHEVWLQTLRSLSHGS